MLNAYKNLNLDMIVRKNVYSTYDNLVKSLNPTYEGSFYNVEEIRQTEEYFTGTEIFTVKIGHSATYLEYSREVYNLFDLLGDLGGVSGMIIPLMAIILTPVSETSFHLAAFKKLFTVNH
jgi:hypothetical protein